MSTFVYTSSSSKKSCYIIENVLPCFRSYIPKNDPLFNQKTFDYQILNNNNILEECPICLNNYKNYNIIKNCGHIFCKRCLFKWKKFSKNCPICRGLIK